MPGVVDREPTETPTIQLREGCSFLTYSCGNGVCCPLGSECVAVPGGTACAAGVSGLGTLTVPGIGSGTGAPTARVSTLPPAESSSPGAQTGSGSVSSNNGGNFQSSKLGTGGIVGIAVGGVAAVIALVAIFVLCCRCYQRQKKPKPSGARRDDTQSEPPSTHGLTKERKKGPVEDQSATDQVFMSGGNMSPSDVPGETENNSTHEPPSPSKAEEPEMTGARSIPSEGSLRGRRRERV